MPQTVVGKKHSGKNETGQTGLNAVRFSSLEEMQAASEAEGWSVEYRQLQAGGLTARTVVGQCGDISLLDEYASRRIEVAGETPEGCATVLVPGGRGTELWVNGKSFDGRSICLLDSRTECQTVTSEGARVLSMHIPKSSLQETARDLFDTWEWRVGRDGILIKCGSAAAQRLRSLMQASIYQPGTRSWQLQRAPVLMTALAAIINQTSGAQAQTESALATKPWRTIRRAIEFVEAHLTDPIEINKVCEYSAASLSSLERTFSRELQMSPSKYILARRLHALRRELKSAKTSGKQVSRLAMDYGFSHLGRFAGVYRAHFGELPSETVRSSWSSVASSDVSLATSTI